MTYKSELEEHYRQVRARLRLGVKSPVVPKALLAAMHPPGGVAGGTGLSPPLVKMPEFKEEEPPLVCESRPKTTGEEERERVKADSEGMPRLARLAGYDYSSPFSGWKRTIAAVANHYELEVDDILGPRRARRIVQARMECMYRMRTELKMSYLSIAEKIGRDHSTVMHGVNTILGRLLDEPKTRMQSGEVPAHGMVPRGDISTQLAAA